MKILFISLLFVTVLFGAWVGVSDGYSLRDACGDLSWYARHPWCVTETVAIVHLSVEKIWSGWAWKISTGTLYVSHAVPVLALAALWAGAAVFGVFSLLSCAVRKE